MIAISEAQLQPLLQAVLDPGSGRALGEAKANRSVKFTGDDVAIEV